MQLHRLIAAAVACAVVLIGGHAVSGPDCKKATAEAHQAQAVLSQAVRNCDAAAAAYYACMKRAKHNRKACAGQKRAHDQAMERKRRAAEAYRFARARQKQACN